MLKRCLPQKLGLIQRTTNETKPKRIIPFLNNLKIAESIDFYLQNGSGLNISQYLFMGGLRYHIKNINGENPKS